MLENKFPFNGGFMVARYGIFERLMTVKLRNERPAIVQSGTR